MNTTALLLAAFQVAYKTNKPIVLRTKYNICEHCGTSDTDNIEVEKIEEGEKEIIVYLKP